jgi:hypothetical protein
MREYDQLLLKRSSAMVDELTRKRIERYAKQRFGSSRYASWLILYTAHCGEFKEGWIPQDYFFINVLPVINPRSIANVSLAKTLTRSLFGDAHSPDIVCRVNGTWISRKGDVLTEDLAREHAFMETDRVFVKADDLNRGNGIRITDKNEFSEVCREWKHDFIVQFPINQHSDLSKFHPISVATLRILTYKTHGSSPRILASYLRLGRGKSRYISPKENPVKVAIDCDSGTLADTGADETWNLYAEHPDSGVAFQSFQCPGFRRAVELCERLHLRIPQLALIGWDVAVDRESDVWLLEWGAITPGFSFIEAASGPLFADLDVAGLVARARGR